MALAPTNLMAMPRRIPPRMETRAERGAACCLKQLSFGLELIAFIEPDCGLELIADCGLELIAAQADWQLSKDLGHVCICTLEAALDFLPRESMRWAKTKKQNSSFIGDREK